MANKQTSSSSSSKAAQRSRAVATSKKAMSNSSEPDEHYDVLSVLYHALKGAQKAQTYQADAEAADDDELAAFFAETHAEYAARAVQAKQLLVERLAGSSEESGEEDEEEEESDDDEEEDDDDDEDEDEE